MAYKIRSDLSSAQFCDFLTSLCLIHYAAVMTFFLYSTAKFTAASLTSARNAFLCPVLLVSPAVPKLATFQHSDFSSNVIYPQGTFSLLLSPTFSPCFIFLLALDYLN